MTAADAESMTVGELLALGGEAAGALLDLRLGYTETWGAPDLREEIARTTATRREEQRRREQAERERQRREQQRRHSHKESQSMSP